MDKGLKRKRLEIPDFADARRLFSRYRYQQKSNHAGHSDLIAEGAKRLEQLEIIIQRVDKLQRDEARVSRWVWRAGVDPERLRADHDRRAGRKSRLGREIELLTEAFYYFAARFCRVVSVVTVKEFKPRGIREVRNDLIEHPEKSKALNPNFTYGLDLDTGPIIKQFGSPAISVKDRGLYANADELIRELVPRLTAAIK